MSTWEKLPLGLYETQVSQNARTLMSGHRGVAWLWEACALLPNALGLNKALRSPSHFGQSRLNYRILWPRREALPPEVLLVRGRRGCGGEIGPNSLGRHGSIAGEGGPVCFPHTRDAPPGHTPRGAPLGKEEHLKMWADILYRHQEASAETEGVQTFR